MAKIIKRLCIPVGSYQPEHFGAGPPPKPKTQYLDIGFLMEHEVNGHTWNEIKLDLHILNPGLLMLVKAQLEPWNKLGSQARVKLYDVTRKNKVMDEAGDGPPVDEEPPF